MSVPQQPAARPFVILSIAFATLVVASTSRHVSLGEPYQRGTLWLAVVFACSAALIGILTLVAVLAPGHWTGRLAFGSTGAAVVVGGWTLFAEWSSHLIWQMVVLGLAESVAMACVLVVARLRGFRFAHRDDSTTARRADRFTIGEMLTLTASIALLSAVGASLRPVELSPNVLGILMIAGSWAALLVFVGCWVVLSKRAVWLRLGVAAAVAPSGGAVYAICDSYEPLLFSAAWYGLVSALVLLLMMGSLAYLESHSWGFRLPPVQGVGESERLV